MRRVARRSRNALIVVVVILIAAAMLAGLFYAGVKAARRQVNRAHTETTISSLMMALLEYHAEFDAYPPGGTDLNDDGDLDDPSEDMGSGRLPADPAHPTVFELRFRTLCVKLSVENNTRIVGPYYSLNPEDIDASGRLTDDWGQPFRYLADGRRTTLDPATGKRLASRVDRREPVIWSVGEDGRQDPGNNNRDDNGNGKVDEADELINDICSWND